MEGERSAPQARGARPVYSVLLIFLLSVGFVISNTRILKQVWQTSSRAIAGADSVATTASPTSTSTPVPTTQPAPAPSTLSSTPRPTGDVTLNPSLAPKPLLSKTSHVAQNATEGASSMGADIQRDFAHMHGALEEKYQNKTILFVFAGRESRLQSQILYLDRLVHDGEVDYVHYYHCRPEDMDSQWMHKLTSILPSWFELRKSPECGENLFNPVYHVYERPEYNTSMLIKGDDDIVFLPVGGGLSELVKYARAHQEALWTSALVVNNPLVDYYLQRDGVIPLTDDLNFTTLPREGDIVGVSTVKQYSDHRNSLCALHDLFLSNTTLFHQQNGVYVVPPGYRVGLNLMVFSPSQVRRWEIPPKRGFDELQIRHASWRLNASVHIFKPAPVVHLNYGRQRQAGLVNTTYEKRYLDFACSYLNISTTPSVLSDALSLC